MPGHQGHLVGLVALSAQQVFRRSVLFSQCAGRKGVSHMRPSFITRRSAINRCREVLGAALAWPALLEFDVRRDQIPSGSAPASESILSRTGINLRATELDTQTLQTVRAYGF